MDLIAYSYDDVSRGSPDWLRVSKRIYQFNASREIKWKQLYGCHRPFDERGREIRHWSESRVTKAVEQAIQMGVVAELEWDRLKSLLA